MDKIPLWKPLLILAVLALCVWGLYPPEKKLKLGIDLRGGTTMIYQVDIPAGTTADSQAEIDSIIAVLQKRVDPTGVRSLLWRRQAGNRIEIQMAQASPNVSKARDAYLKLREDFFKGNMTNRQIDAALRDSGLGRTKALESLAGGNPQMLAALEKVSKAFDELEAKREPYEAAMAERRKLVKQRDAVPAGATTQTNEFEKKLTEFQPSLTAKTTDFLAARKQYDSARIIALAANIDPAVIERTFGLSNKPGNNGPDGKPTASARQKAIDDLKSQYPTRAASLGQLADAAAAYDAVKGPLDDPTDLIQLLRSSGVLEFRVAAVSGELADAKTYRDQLTEKGPRAGADAPWVWVPIDDVASYAKEKSEQDLLRGDPEGFFTRRGMIGQAYGPNIYVLLSNQPGSSLTSAQPNWQLANAYPTVDQMMFPAVAFELNPEGGRLMGELTEGNLKKAMAIVLDGKVMSSPNIQGRISTNGQITGGSGGFTRKELDYLIRTLKAGSLKARLSPDPISIQTTGPQFGEDNLDSGLKAAVWSTVIVSLFMIGYYYVLGGVATFALFANIVIILGVMAAISAVFTLPGIAGIVLTIGMAVDGNVLVYERIREELANKATLAHAIRAGYQRAFATILDSHVTMLISAVVLGYTASADIKGFAIVFGIGLIANLFTAVFCSRVLTEYYVQIFKPKTIGMLSITFPAVRKAFHPNFDWIGKAKYSFIFSGIIIVLGLGSAIKLGEDMLDIEFRAGTQVSFHLAEGKSLSIHDARQRLDKAAEKYDMPTLSGERATVVTVGPLVDGKATGFTISTLAGADQSNVNVVSDAVKFAFAGLLNSQPSIKFDGESETLGGDNRVFAVKKAALGETIGRADIKDSGDASDFVGGVAIYLQNMEPAISVSDLRQRIKTMHAQPQFENLGYRPFEVVGIDPAGTNSTSADAAPLYKSAVVLVRDDQTNYAADDKNIKDPAGLAQTEWQLASEALKRETSLGSVTRFSPQVSGTLKQQTIAAMFLSCMAIVVYIWIRFGSLRYGLAAIGATIHDIAIALAFLAFSHYLAGTAIGNALGIHTFRIDLAQVAAILTLIGFSLNDTIVVFDRIRENRGRLAVASPSIINDAINQTISRTVLTSSTAAIAVFILYLIGGPGVHGFSYTMLVGVVFGTYSSIAIASPLLLLGPKNVETDTTDTTPVKA